MRVVKPRRTLEVLSLALDQPLDCYAELTVGQQDSEFLAGDGPQNHHGLWVIDHSSGSSLLHIGSVVWLQQFLRSSASSDKCSRLRAIEAEESRVSSDIDLVQAGYRNISREHRIARDNIARRGHGMRFNPSVTVR
jgi:hypothetical protein